MADVVSTLLRWALRLVLLAMGLVFALSLLVMAGVLLCAWALRTVWAKLTGQPVVPCVMGVDPRAAWRRFNQKGSAAQAPGDPEAVEKRPFEERFQGRFKPRHGEVSDAQLRDKGKNGT